MLHPKGQMKPGDLRKVTCFDFEASTTLPVMQTVPPNDWRWLRIDDLIMIVGIETSQGIHPDHPRKYVKFLSTIGLLYSYDRFIERETELLLT